MASIPAVKKAFTLPPTVRSLPSGVPGAVLLNLGARPPQSAHGHGHGHGPSSHRSDVPAKFARETKLSSSGLVTKSVLTRES